MTKRQVAERRAWQLVYENEDWMGAVRRRLAELGMSQEQLARRIDVPLTRINRHLNGVGEPGVEELRAIAKALAEAELDSARGRFLSAPDLAYIMDPKFSPLRVYGTPWIVESPLLRVAA